MKKIIGGVLILAVVILGGYYGMGFVTEHTFKKNIAIINQINGLHVDVADYKRHIMCSTAMLNWTVHVPSRVVKDSAGHLTTAPSVDYKLEMPLKVYHGPVIFADSRTRFGLGYARTELNLPKEYVDKFYESYTKESIQPIIKLSVFVNYLNKSTLISNVPLFKLLSKDGNDQFVFDGAESVIYSSLNLDVIDGSLALDGMNWLNDGVKVALGKATSNYKLHRTANNLYLGDANLYFTTLLVTEADKKIFEVNQLDLQSNSDAKDGLFYSEFTASVDKVVANDRVYGPGYLRTAIRNIDEKTLADMNGQLNKIQQGTVDERRQALLALLPGMTQLFNRGAEFEITELSVALPDGVLKGNMKLALPAGEMSNPFLLAQKIMGSAKISVNIPVLKAAMLERVKHQQSSVQLTSDNANRGTTTVSEDTLVTQGVLPAKVEASTDMSKEPKVLVDEAINKLIKVGALVVSGSDYVIDVQLEQGKLIVNGHPFASEMLQY